MKAWWYYFAQEFTPEECRFLLQASKEYPWHEGAIGHGTGSVVHKKTRDSNVKWLPRNASLRPIFDRIALCALRANREAFGFELNSEPFLDFQSLQFTEYSAKGEQHYDWHIDNAWIDRNGTKDDRKISCVIQLTDPTKYEGGKLELEEWPIQEGKFEQAGDMIFFPSFLKHRVTPVTRGVRHSLVTWIKGPRFR